MQYCTKCYFKCCTALKICNYVAHVFSPTASTFWYSCLFFNKKWYNLICQGFLCCIYLILSPAKEPVCSCILCDLIKITSLNCCGKYSDFCHPMGHLSVLPASFIQQLSQYSGQKHNKEDRNHPYIHTLMQSILRTSNSLVYGLIRCSFK